MQAYPPDVQEFMREKLASGQYSSEQDLVAEAMRILRVVGEHHDALYGEVQAGLNELHAGKAQPWDKNALKNALDDMLDKAA